MDMIIYLAAMVLVIWAQVKVNGAYQRYRNVATRKGYRGVDVARKILNRYGLNDVQIEMASGGMLSDHYDPKTNTVRLSKDIYYNDSIASISVAAHEVGHAIQHATNYSMIALRTKILPIAMISSSLGWTVTIMGLMFSIDSLFYVGVMMLGLIALFQLITLPIELDASKRALTILNEEAIIVPDEYVDCKAMLSAAAFTYIASLISTLLQIARLFLMRNRRRN
ncbi:MAG: zinc metallopeptidase [Erysipelotrichaceae bacterium]|nr:zinc metallopeptidase [Erysipelotrichaceae bacterium]